MSDEPDYDSPEFQQFVDLLADIIIGSMEREAQAREAGEPIPERELDPPDMWEVRELPNGMTLELKGGRDLCLVLVQSEKPVAVELSRVKTVAAALVDRAADLIELLAAGG